MKDKYLIRRNGRLFDPRTIIEVEETRDYEYNEKAEKQKIAKRMRAKAKRKNA